MQGVKAKTEIVEEHSSPGHMDIPLGGRKKDKKKERKILFQTLLCARGTYRKELNVTLNNILLGFAYS